MSLEIITCEQGSPEWFQARLGIPTASEFSTVIAKGRDGKSESKGRRTYMLKLAGEIFTGEVADSYTNAHMERGKVMEDEARRLYEFACCNEELVRVGFMRDGAKGASPDSLIGKNGGLEIKTALPHIQIERLLLDRLPPEHTAQVQGNLWVSNREWWDFVSYWPTLPLFVKRVYRDESYIANTLKPAVEQFNVELLAVVEIIKKLGGLPFAGASGSAQATRAAPSDATPPSDAKGGAASARPVEKV